MAARSPRAVANDSWARTVAAFSTVVERVTPWLLDLGSWIFGALIAFNLLILGALLTVGPADVAVLVAAAAIAFGLPPAVAGFVLLRLAADLKKVDLETLATTAFVEAGFSVEGTPAKPDPKEVERRQASVVLRYSYALLAVTGLMTLVALTAALWHLAWWIGVLFLIVAIVSQLAVFRAIVTAGSSAAWRS
jgi:hypothetical protein